MNTRDIRNSRDSQELFWAIAAPISLAIIIFASFFAFRGSIKHWYSSIRAKQSSVLKEEDMFDSEGV